MTDGSNTLPSGFQVGSSVQNIAESLTYSQREAVCGRFAWKSPDDQEEGEAVLCELGLWNITVRHGGRRVTDLGLQVRDFLRREQGSLFQSKKAVGAAQ